MDQDNKKKLEKMKSDLRWDCNMAYLGTSDRWYREKVSELDPPKPKIISKEEVKAQIRKIKRLEKKLSTTK